MDKGKIIELLQYAQVHLNDVSAATLDDADSLNEAYIYISEALDLLKS